MVFFQNVLSTDKRSIQDESVCLIYIDWLIDGIALVGRWLHILIATVALLSNVGGKGLGQFEKNSGEIACETETSPAMPNERWARVFPSKDSLMRDYHYDLRSNPRSVETDDRKD